MRIAAKPRRLLAGVLALLVPAVGCHCRAESVGLPNEAGTSPLDPAFVWTCSPDDDVGCSGVFEVRDAGCSATAITGREALGARLASLEGATRSIRIQALIFRADETGLRIAELLERRKAEGLDVRVIVDATSNLDWQTQWMYFDLERHGIVVEGYEALYLEWLTAEKLFDPLHANKRFHDKLWVIDGEDPERGLAIVGGLNLANEYFRVDDDPINLWSDQDVLLRGPVVRDVMAAFDRNADFFAGIKARLPRVLNPDNAWKLSAPVLQRVAAVDIPTWPDPELHATVLACTNAAPGPMSRPTAARFLQSRPRMRETYILQAYLAAIEAAESSILIANAYFIPSRAIRDALLRAVDRGVEVVVLTNSPASNDIQQVATVSRHTYQGLMREDGGGVAIHEWIGPSVGEGTLHAKFALFDGVEAIVGSYNLDPRSEQLNSETAIALRDPVLVGGLVRRFREQMLPKAERVTWDAARSYHAPGDLRQRFELLSALPLESWL